MPNPYVKAVIYSLHDSDSFFAWIASSLSFLSLIKTRKLKIKEDKILAILQKITVSFYWLLPWTEPIKNESSSLVIQNISRELHWVVQWFVLPNSLWSLCTSKPLSILVWMVISIILYSLWILVFSDFSSYFFCLILFYTIVYWSLNIEWDSFSSCV